MPSYHWIKLYHEILHDPKMGRLSDHLWRRAIELFLLAGETGRDGALPPPADIAWQFRTTEAELLADLQDLAQVDIVSMEEGGAWTVTKFAARQAPMDDAERKRRQRERDRKQDYYGHDSGQADVTNRDTDKSRVDKSRAEAETEEEKEPETAAGAFLAATGGLINPIMVKEIQDFVDELEKHRQGLGRDSPGAALSGEEWFIHGVREAVASNSRRGPISLNYVKAILNTWMTEGYRQPKGKSQKRGRVKGL